MLPADIEAELKRAAGDLDRFRGNRYEQFDCIRTTMKRLTSVDAFYVAEFVGENAVHFHHQYDGDFFELPGSVPVRPGRMAYWVRANKRSYLYSDDNGRLLHAGLRFGRMDKVSRDAVVVPVFGDTANAQVIGLVSTQSYTSGVYDQAIVSVLEQLAELLSNQVTFEARAARRGPCLGMASSDDRAAEDVLGDVLDRLQELQAKIQKSVVSARLPNYDAEASLRLLRRDVESLQAGLCARDLQQRHVTAERLAKLTRRQRELALLLANDTGGIPTNVELAATMQVTEDTVKSHLNAILRVFGTTDKREFCAVVRRLAGHRTHRDDS
jgi:DNA-binding CsgD family transcriptional regulator